MNKNQQFALWGEAAEKSEKRQLTSQHPKLCLDA